MTTKVKAKVSGVSTADAAAANVGGTDRYAKIKSKSRHESQNTLLSGFANNPNATAKEVAFKVLSWSREGYCNAQKRAYDLCSDRLAYLEKTGERRCLMSKALCSVYVITARGKIHLQKLGLKLPGKAVMNVDEMETKVDGASGDVDDVAAIASAVGGYQDKDRVVEVVKSSGLGSTEAIAVSERKVTASGGMPDDFLTRFDLGDDDGATKKKVLLSHK